MKCTEEGRTVENDCKAALKQIEEKNYLRGKFYNERERTKS